MALIDRRFRVRLQNIPRGECLEENGLCTRHKFALLENMENGANSEGSENNTQRQSYHFLFPFSRNIQGNTLKKLRLSLGFYILPRSRYGGQERDIQEYPIVLKDPQLLRLLSWQLPLLDLLV